MSRRNNRARHLHLALAEHFQLDFEPIELKVPWVIRFTVLASSNGYAQNVSKIL
jgi:hypothetical protein